MAGTKCFFDSTSLCLPERQHPELSEKTLQGLGTKVSKNMGHSLVTMMTHFAILRFDPAASITGFAEWPRYLLVAVTSSRQSFSSTGTDTWSPQSTKAAWSSMAK